MKIFDDIQELGKPKGLELIPGTYQTNKYDLADFTLTVDSSIEIRLTVGASPEHACANSFNKRSLQMMIDDLQSVCDAMEES